MRRERFLPAAALAAGLACIVPARAALPDMPKRKPGMWEIITTSTRGGKPGVERTMTQCIDESTDAAMMQMASGATAQHKCKVDSRRSGNRIDIHSECQMGASVTRTDGFYEGDFTSSYRAEMRHVYSPPVMGMAEATTVLRARWAGACSPGMRPGDMSVPGMKGYMNVNELMKALPHK